MPDFTDKPNYAFEIVPPTEASRYFKNKGIQPSFSWYDVEPEEHAVSFAVAKAMQVDVLEAVQQALQQALDEGIPYREFTKQLRPRLRKLGWWGIKKQMDPLTGKARKVQLGSPRRLKTIYRANMRSARAAGQWDRIERTKQALPYLQYLLGPSERHRPLHQAKSGIILPVDDPFWSTWYPPNGWNCKCHVRQITRREAEATGISDSPDIPMREFFNRRTGEVKRIPSGIDPGWEMNPGQYRQRNMERFLNGKLDVASPAIARAAAKDIASSWRFMRIHDGSAKGAVPVAMVPDDLAKLLGAKTRVVQFSSDTAFKQKATHPELISDDYAELDKLIHEGLVVTQGNNHLGFIGRDYDLPKIAVIKVTRNNSEIYLQTLYKPGSARYIDRFIKRGTIIRK